MSINSFKVSKSLTLGAQTAAPSSPTNGEQYYDSTLGKMQFRENGAWSTIGSSSGSLAWSVVTSTSQTIVSGNGYVANNAALVSFPLPSTAAVGDFFAIAGFGAGGWRITQAAGQSIIRDTVQTATGTSGFLMSSQQNSCVEIVCIVANTTFIVRNSQGTTSAGTGALNGYLAGGSEDGGSTAVTTIQKIVFSTDTVSTIVATQSTGRRAAVGFCSPTKGYQAAGESTSTVLTSIEALTFSGESQAALLATLATAVWLSGGIFSDTKGYCVGGELTGGSRTNVFQALTFSGETTATITATLSATKEGICGVSSATKGYSLGGATPSNQNTIEALTFSGETNTTLGATLPTTKGFSAANGAISSTKGYLMGGESGGGSDSASIVGFTFGTETAATLGVTLSVATEQSAVCFSSVAGYHAGGSGTAAIDKLVYSGETTSTLVTGLSHTRNQLVGIQG